MAECGLGVRREVKYLGYLRALEGSPAVSENEQMWMEVGDYASKTIWGCHPR